MLKTTLFLTLAAVLISWPGMAQTPADEPDLAVSLAAAQPPTGGVAIAVAADRTLLPKGAVPPSEHSLLGGVADAYGRLLQPFGSVIAIAPPTMVILNIHPAGQGPGVNPPPDEALQLLGASLDDAQWQAFTSSRGLGMDDLNDGLQRRLFADLFQGESLQADVSSPRESPPVKWLTVTISAQDLLQSRIRATRKIAMWIQTPDSTPVQSSFSVPPVPSKTPRFYARPLSAQGKLYGQPVRSIVPNSPKPGELNLKDQGFDSLIPVTGLKTVGDLVGRIGLTTHTEIYVDRRSESKTLTVIGTTATAPTRDLLQALAFDLTGTYRNVGPAFVLTDDRMGVGTRRAIISQYQQSLETSVRPALENAQKALEDRRLVNDLPFSSDSLPLSPEQIREANQMERQRGPRGPILTAPLDQLTPAQQNLARGIVDKVPAGQDAPVMLMSELKLEAVSSKLSGPLDLTQVIDPRSLFPPPGTAKVLAMIKQLESPPPPIMNAPSVADLIRPYKHRAAIVQPRTPAEVDALIGPMEKLGLNEMWLVVSGPYLPNAADPAPHHAAGEASPSFRMDLLTEAVKATDGTGIFVLPLINLTRWGANTPASARDLNIMGEDTAQINDRERERSESETGLPQPPWPAEFDVSPFSSEVQDQLVDIVGRASAVPGIAGIVWRSINPNGYEGTSLTGMGQAEFNMGFTLTSRLAFLRKYHVDPIDIDFTLFNHNLDESLPEFDDPEENQAIRNEWAKFLAQEDQEMLRRLLGVARAAAHTTIPVLVEGQNWFISWNNPAEPVLSEAHPVAVYDTILRTVTARPGADIDRVNVDDRGTVQMVERQLTTNVKKWPWNGVALDLTYDPETKLPPDQLLSRLLAVTGNPPSKTPTPAGP
ncbi:MAG TPA: hypothetical protein VFJ58_22825 [Armatimonadota bacterium]|nr:hypothetical protein [Armatimonadota bacterium]